MGVDLMKLNNKGFAVTGILYTALLMFLVVISGILSMMSTRKVLLDKMKQDTLESLDEVVEVDYNLDSYLNNDMVVFYDGITNAERVKNNEIANTVFEDIVNSNHGTLLSFDFNSDSGWGDNYLKFDGVNDIVETPIYASDFADIHDDFTMSMVVKINKVSIGGNQDVDYDSSTIFGATYYSGFGIYWTTSDVLTTQYRLGIMMSNNSGNASTTYTSTDFGIQHISFVFNRTNNKQSLYVNGNKVAERTVIAKGDFDHASNMGNIKFGGSGLYGGNSRNVRTDMNLYTAKIYNRALTATEVKKEYEIDKHRYSF